MKLFTLKYKKKMKNHSYLFIVLIGILAFTHSACRDEFALLNSNPNQITGANPSYMMASVVNNFEPGGYLLYFYNAPMMYAWSQMAVPAGGTGGFNGAILTTTSTGDQDRQYVTPMRNARDLENVRANIMDQEEADKFAYTAACMDVLLAYLGILATDMYGDIPFIEAGRARYGGSITPPYDRVEDLYDYWLSQLDDAIVTFTTATDQTFPASQDAVYGGNVERWAKLANSLKLRIAARLISQNRAKALSIAEAVANEPYINSIADAMLFNKLTTGNDNLIYRWSNTFMDGSSSGNTGASARVIDFMLNNKDPRVRFCYQKHGWNATIIQHCFDTQNGNFNRIPPHIEALVEYDVDSDGKKTFVEWKGMGEPWVRYVGLPVEINANQDNANRAYFYGGTDYPVYDGNSEGRKTYATYSGIQQQMIIGRNYRTNVPTVPGGPVIQGVQQRPYHGLYFGAAEANLFLAEFSLLGASLPEAASVYYERGLRFSVEEYDRMAELNQIAYYGSTYDYCPHEVSIELKDGEIDAMMDSPDYQLTGTPAEQLEKVYIQQLLNFTLYPNDQFVTARRSGVPKFGSSFLAREDFGTAIPTTSIPRRFDTGVPSPTNLMYDIMMQAYQRQGLTTTAYGSTSQSPLLNSERLWMDVNAPQWGAGPTP